MDCMFCCIQIVQSCLIGGTVVIEIRRCQGRESRLRHVELGFRRRKLIFIIVEERVELCLLSSRRIADSLLNFRTEASQFDINIDSYIELEPSIISW